MLELIFGPKYWLHLNLQSGVLFPDHMLGENYRSDVAARHLKGHRGVKLPTALCTGPKVDAPYTASVRLDQGSASCGSGASRGPLVALQRLFEALTKTRIKLNFI